MDRRERGSTHSRNADRFVSTRQVVGFVGFVGLSALTMAGASGATPSEMGLLGAFGLLLGVAIILAIGVTPWQE